MNFSSCPLKLARAALALFPTILIVAAARGDLIELTNGDHYRGTVMGMTLTNIDFLSEVQGRVKLPRDKVAQITLHEVVGRPAASNISGLSLTTANPTPTSATPNNAPVTSDAVLQQLRSQGVDPKLITQVQEQIFGKASPEAAQKFNEMINGLMSGKLSVKDLRSQAQDSINQIRTAKKELGGDAGGMLDSYLSILEKFVQETSDDAVSPATQLGASTRNLPKR